MGPRLPDSIPGQGEPGARTGTVQKIPEAVSGELSTQGCVPSEELSVLQISRNDLVVDFSDFGRNTQWGSGHHNALSPHHSPGVGALPSSHLCPCLSSALGVPTGTRSWSGSTQTQLPLERGAAPQPLGNKGGSWVLLSHLQGNVPWFPRPPWAAEKSSGRHSRGLHSSPALRMRSRHRASFEVSAGPGPPPVVTPPGV